MNTERRERLRDAAIDVLAGSGARGLTHRAVDAVAQVPEGTTKNYFATRDALLRAVAERCVELYDRIPAEPPSDRAGLARLLSALLADVEGPGRPRLQAVFELQAEAARKPWLAAVLDAVTATDFARFRQAVRAAGLPATPARVSAITLALHSAVLHLLTGGPRTIEAAGLNDLDLFVGDLLDSVFGP
ncbi:TetR/AcrR family transcriptional regulator [Nonomuraea longicatena]|uniref:TetR/AcrR family transcriptional regulator n=1 Tax=Nonomuraea longicatena TaxID=83682 RepID=A0ABP4AQK3_9ACTN